MASTAAMVVEQGLKPDPLLVQATAVEYVKNKDAVDMAFEADSSIVCISPLRTLCLSPMKPDSPLYVWTTIVLYMQFFK